jgi:hypothetical protein
MDYIFLRAGLLLEWFGLRNAVSSRLGKVVANASTELLFLRVCRSSVSRTVNIARDSKLEGLKWQEWDTNLGSSLLRQGATENNGVVCRMSFY